MTMFFENQHVQFGHVRLSIFDLTDGVNQPFVNIVNGSTLAFYGEIFNYKQLESDHQFLSQSDTEALFVGLQQFCLGYVYKLQDYQKND
jgi:asparagine synthetase B (glutamine-hydrolysing)